MYLYSIPEITLIIYGINIERCVLYNLTNKTYFTRSYDDKNCKKSLKIPKGLSESVYRRTDNTMHIENFDKNENMVNLGHKVE
jgi:hypothetical protein